MIDETTTNFPTPLWLQKLLNWERYVNDGSPNRLSFVNAPSAGYSPRFGLPVVDIPLIATRNSQLAMHGAGTGSALLDFCAANSCIPIHPDAVGYYFQHGRQYDVLGTIRGAPSASGRTLLVRVDDRNFTWIKLSYPGLLGRFGSSLDSAKVKHSIDMSNRLSRVGVSHLAERSGLVLALDLGRDSRSEIGCVIRDVVVDGVSEMNVVPAFSVLSRSSDHDNEILSVFGVSPGASIMHASESVLEHLFMPILVSYWHSVVQAGALPEAHPQNVLFELSQDPDPVTVVYRDCQGFIGDATYSTSANDRIFTMSEDALFEERSRRYDDYLTQYLLLPLLWRVAGFVEVSFDAIIAELRRMTAELCPVDYFNSSSEWFEMPLDQVHYGRRIDYARRCCKPLLR